MIRCLLPLVILGWFSGCCSWGNKSEPCVNKFKPPLNCLGSAYDGSSAPCYHPPGPFWCCLPGPCSTCRDPYLQCYLDSHAHWIGRYVCDPNASPTDGDNEEYTTVSQSSAKPRVIHQAKAEE